MAAALIAAPDGATAGASAKVASTRYNHIVEIMMENTKYSQIIGNSQAPTLNKLASKYYLATNDYGVTHPSEPNYMAAISGSYFGVQDDNEFYCTAALASTDPHCGGTTVNHTVSAPNLARELSAAKMTWKGYIQSLPPAPAGGKSITSGPTANGPYAFKWPSNTYALYALKHNPFVNFTTTQSALSQMTSDTQFFVDAATGTLPNYALVVPDQCHDMHGTSGCSDTNHLTAAGDAYVNQIVTATMASKSWTTGNNAIVIT